MNKVRSSSHSYKQALVGTKNAAKTKWLYPTFNLQYLRDAYEESPKASCRSAGGARANRVRGLNTFPPRVSRY
jgi:hypothetical protein